MILLALKSIFFLTAVLGYSTGIWRLIGNYFHQEFKTYLDEEVKKNKYLLVDPARENPPPGGAGSSTVEIVTESEVRQAGRSVTANRLLDEIIINFGRLFTTRNEAEFSRKRTSETKPGPVELAEEIKTSTSRSVGKENSPPDPDPGGTPASAAAAVETIIESDKFPRSSSSEVDNKSDEDDVAGEEEKWIKYWKTRKERGGTASGEHYCAAKLDACGP